MEPLDEARQLRPLLGSEDAGEVGDRRDRDPGSLVGEGDLLLAETLEGRPVHLRLQQLADHRLAVVTAAARDRRELVDQAVGDEAGLLTLRLGAIHRAKGPLDCERRVLASLLGILVSRRSYGIAAATLATVRLVGQMLSMGLAGLLLASSWGGSP